MKKICVTTLVLAMITMTYVSIAQSKPKKESNNILMQQIQGTEISQIVLEIPESVTEGESFIVYVYGPEVEGFAVGFQYGDHITLQENTGPDGSVTLTAPLVDEDTSFIITARKKGHKPCHARITILNNDEMPLMELEIPQSVIEGESFVVFVHGSEIEGVAVGFQYGDLFIVEGYTGPDGSVTLTAPMVDEDTIFRIIARKTGYPAFGASITILNKISTNYIYL